MTNSAGTAEFQIDHAPRKRSTILLCAGQGAMHQGLAQAIRSHLPDTDVLLVEELPEPNGFVGKPDLILLDQKSRGPILGGVAACRRAFAGVPIGVVLWDGEQGAAGCKALFDRGEVQGLLPLDLTLEVWLAALDLLTKGGEYCPPGLSRNRQQFAAKPSVSTSLDPLATFRVSAPETIHLTPRERQVLELLSEGYQNKLIADRMALSEHTVKVHVHNVITKMRVSNRTQAAAAYRSGRYAVPAPMQDHPLLGAYQFRGRH